jgi:four helix bundle protein
MSIASKEARETSYWLKLINQSEIVQVNNLDEIMEKSQELIRMLTAIVKTSQTNS